MVRTEIRVMAWANLDLDPDLPNHPKLIALEADIGNTALSHIIRLWCWVYRFAPDGNIWKYRNPDFLERQVMGWTGESGTLLQALIKHRWIDRGRGKSLTIHGWLERNKRVLEYRLSQSQKSIKRWDEYKRRHKMLQPKEVDEPAPDAPAMPRDEPQQRSGNASYLPPYPSLPTNPTTPTSLPAKDESGGGGGLASPGEEHLASLRRMHRDTFGKDSVPFDAKEWSSRIERDGFDLVRWEYAYAEGARLGARGIAFVLKAYDNFGQPKEHRGVKHLPGMEPVFDERGQHLGYRDIDEGPLG